MKLEDRERKKSSDSFGAAAGKSTRLKKGLMGKRSGQQQLVCALVSFAGRRLASSAIESRKKFSLPLCALCNKSCFMHLLDLKCSSIEVSHRNWR